MPLRRPMLGLLVFVCASAFAQDTLTTMPRYDRYEKLRREISNSVKRGVMGASWADDSQSFTFYREGTRYRFDLKTRKEAVATDDDSSGRQQGRNRRAPDRGRQFDTAYSPDGKLKAVSRDRNVYVSDADGKNEVAITTEGSKEHRIKYGIASWVYGEELEVREAMWWSPDGKRLAFYRFDEGPVKDFYLQYDQTKIQDTLDVEAYPKAGAPNPVVTLMVYDLATHRTTTVETQFADPSLGEYVYDVRWSPDGSELLYNRTNRKQNVMEFCAADPVSGKSRAVVRESQPQSWAENHPTIQFLKDGKRFIWSSEQSGFRNLYLYDLSGRRLSTITRQTADVERIVRISDDERTLWYTARTGANPYLPQLHRVGLNGRRERRLTDPNLAHSVSLAPDGKHFIDVAQAVDVPPRTILRGSDGQEIAELSHADVSKFESLGLKKVERFTFTAADGKTICYGRLDFPSDFDPSKKYPVIVSIYGGPESGGGAESFQTPNPITELGFLHVWMDGRGTSGRGKAFRDAVYGKLGVVEMDDQAAGIAELAKRPYVDAKRVGIYGTSYGGYASVMAILRHPETFAVASASSAVTDWRNYDSIYTERFMGLPAEGENKAGYDAGSAMTYAKNLKGKLLLYYGTADNNVHPSNTLQLVKALEDAGKRYDMQVGPDRGHTGVNSTRMWEYFVTHLILESPRRDALAMHWRSRKTLASK